MSKIRSFASTTRRRLLPVEELNAQVEALRKLNRRLEKAVGRVEGTKKPAPKTPPKTGDGLPSDFDEEAKAVIASVRPYTMTSPDKLFALILAVRHIAGSGVEGALVECGVWRGGSMHAVARTLLSSGVTDRELYLFDTFAGMTEPTDKDLSAGGTPAATLLANAEKSAYVWAIASLEDVRQGLATLDYPQERFHLVEGPVEKTIPSEAPEQIALLRLDTDWYESTRHELEHLYDRLVPGGVLIIDDYGSWQGAKEATDEFIAALERKPLMLRAGRSRIGVKPA
jgi:O-methyltransferase